MQGRSFLRQYQPRFLFLASSARWCPSQPHAVYDLYVVIDFFPPRQVHSTAATRRFVPRLPPISIDTKRYQELEGMTLYCVKYKRPPLLSRSSTDSCPFHFLIDILIISNSILNQSNAELVSIQVHTVICVAWIADKVTSHACKEKEKNRNVANSVHNYYINRLNVDCDVSSTSWEFERSCAVSSDCSSRVLRWPISSYCSSRWLKALALPFSRLLGWFSRNPRHELLIVDWPIGPSNQ